MSTTTAAAPDANKLKSLALNKFDEALLLIAAARANLCDLEGQGYCRSYERLLRNMDDLANETAHLRRLAPPTGVFQP